MYFLSVFSNMLQHQIPDKIIKIIYFPVSVPLQVWMAPSQRCPQSSDYCVQEKTKQFFKVTC